MYSKYFEACNFFFNYKYVVLNIHKFCFKYLDLEKQMLRFYCYFFIKQNGFKHTFLFLSIS